MDTIFFVCSKNMMQKFIVSGKYLNWKVEVENLELFDWLEYGFDLIWNISWGYSKLYVSVAQIKAHFLYFLSKNINSWKGFHLHDNNQHFSNTGLKPQYIIGIEGAVTFVLTAGFDWRQYYLRNITFKIIQTRSITSLLYPIFLVLSQSLLNDETNNKYDFSILYNWLYSISILILVLW